MPENGLPRSAQHTLLNIGVPDVAVSQERPRAALAAAEKFAGIGRLGRSKAACAAKNWGSGDPNPSQMSQRDQPRRTDPARPSFFVSQQILASHPTQALTGEAVSGTTRTWLGHGRKCNMFT